MLMKIAQVSCKQAAFLVSKGSLTPLSFLERWRLKRHLKLCTCPICHGFADESKFIDDAIGAIMSQREKQKTRLTEEQRNKILEALK